MKKLPIALCTFALAAAASVTPGFVIADHHGAVQVESERWANASLLLPIRNARIPMDGVLSGGQPTREQIESAAEAGFRTVINLRGGAERGFEWEPELVRELGMTYEHLPVTGKDSLTREHVEQIDAVLNAALEEGPVLLHCASGNRIGTVLALRAAWIEGVDPEEALTYGRDSGMTRAEGLARELLGLDPSPAD
jgi:uncharacterized protein (TIGR01244 family)